MVLSDDMVHFLNIKILKLIYQNYLVALNPNVQLAVHIESFDSFLFEVWIPMMSTLVLLSPEVNPLIFWRE